VATLDELVMAEPRIGDLEREVDAIRDDGSGELFCSNYYWLPVNTRLRLLVGVARIPRPGDEDHRELYDSRNYEIVFQHLSRRLPPCRGCGCHRFEVARAETMPS